MKTLKYLLAISVIAIGMILHFSIQDQKPDPLDHHGELSKVGVIEPLRSTASVGKEIKKNRAMLGDATLEKAYAAMIERIAKRDEKSKALVYEVMEQLQKDGGKSISVNNLPVNENGIYILKRDYMTHLVPDPVFRAKWVQFLKLVNQDRKEQAISYQNAKKVRNE